LDRFAEPLAEGDIESRRRARFLVGACWVVAVWGPVFAAIDWANDKPGLIGVLAAAGGIGAALPFVLRATRRLAVAGLAVSLFYFAVLSVVAWATGGQEAPVLWWLASAPMMAAALCGLRTGVLFAVAAIAEYAFFLFAPGFGYVTPYPYTPEQLSLDLFATMSALTIIVLSILAVFKPARRRRWVACRRSMPSFAPRRRPAAGRRRSSRRRGIRRSRRPGRSRSSSRR